MSSDTAVVERPTSIEELADLLRTTQRDQPQVSIRGAGSKQSWGAPEVPPQLVIDTTALDRIVEHAVGDLVVTVEAGTPLTTVQEQLAAARQWLPLDPPEPGATVGGIVATGASGPRRLRFGTPRDLVIGMTVVLADGTVARSGGKVVKNVAGYDLGRLFTGSFGTLGVIASVTCRLHPLAAARRVVEVAAANPVAAAEAVAASSATPSAVEWDGARVTVVLESTPSAADAMAANVATTLGTSAVTAELPDGFGSRPWRSGQVGLKMTHRLSALGATVTALRRALPGARLSAQLGSGVVWAGADAALVTADALADLRAVAAAHDGTVVVVDAPDDVKAAVDVWGPVRGLETMRRIKERFDPESRLNRGRFVGGI